MAFPAGVQTVTVTGRIAASDGDALIQNIVFTPSVNQVVSTTLNLIIDTHPVVVPLASDGTFTVTLIATDASGFNPQNWTYTVSRGSYPDYSISLPAASPTVDLADLTPVTPSPAVYNLLSSSQAVGMTSGITYGGSMDPHPTNTIAVTIQPLQGYIVDALQTPPVISHVVTSSVITVQLDTAAQARAVTWFLMDANQIITQQETRPSPEQRRTHIVLGFAAQTAGVIFNVQSIPVILQQPTNQLYDLIDSIGAFNISGNTITANGANLFLNHNPGQIFSRGWNHYAGPVQTNNPHIINTTGDTPALWYRATRSTNVTGSTFQAMDVGNYDNNGVVTPIGGGANQATNQRLWIFPSNDGVEAHVAQYGQNVYSSLSAAVAAINTQPYVNNPILPGNGVLVAFLSAIRTATNLSDPAQAQLTIASRFRFL